MDAASKDNFKELSINMPCCGKKSTLNDLHYDLLCGFACIEFDILNPSTDLTMKLIQYRGFDWQTNSYGTRTYITPGLPGF